MPHALMGHYRCVGHIPTLYMRLDATCATGRQKPLFTHTHTPAAGWYAGLTLTYTPAAFVCSLCLYAPYVWFVCSLCLGASRVLTPECCQTKVFPAIILPAPQPIYHRVAIIVAKIVCDHVNRYFEQDHA